MSYFFTRFLGALQIGEPLYFKLFVYCLLLTKGISRKGLLIFASSVRFAPWQHLFTRRLLRDQVRATWFRFQESIPFSLDLQFLRYWMFFPCCITRITSFPHIMHYPELNMDSNQRSRSRYTFEKIFFKNSTLVKILQVLFVLYFQIFINLFY